MNLLRKDQDISEVRGLGLMIGLSYEKNIQELRKNLLFKKCIFTGVSGTNVIRLLPPLTLTKEMADHFVAALSDASVSS